MIVLGVRYIDDDAVGELDHPWNRARDQTGHALLVLRLDFAVKRHLPLLDLDRKRFPIDPAIRSEPLLDAELDLFVAWHLIGDRLNGRARTQRLLVAKSCRSGHAHHNSQRNTLNTQTSAHDYPPFILGMMRNI